MAAKNDILRDKDGNQIFPATTAEQVSYDGKINIKQAIKNEITRNKTAPTAASMTNKEQIYVYTGTEEGYTFGNWYYWDGVAWTSGGAYNAIEVNTDRTLTEEGAPADAKATGDKLSELKNDLSYNGIGTFEKILIMDSGYRIMSNGTLIQNDAYEKSNPVYIKKGEKVTINAMGYNNEIALLAEYVDGQAQRIPLIVSSGSGAVVEKREYVATHDMLVELTNRKANEQRKMEVTTTNIRLDIDELRGDVKTLFPLTVVKDSLYYANLVPNVAEGGNINGLTVIPIDNGKFVLNGHPTSDGIYGIYNVNNALPNGFAVDVEYGLQVLKSISGVVYTVMSYNGSAWTTLYNDNKDLKFTIPSDAKGLQIRLYFTTYVNADNDEIEFSILPTYNGRYVENRVDKLHKAPKAPKPLLTIIDDDGNKKFETMLLPIIQRKKVPISSSVIVGSVGTTAYEMTWDSIENCAKNGAEILSHSNSHIASVVGTVVEMAYDYRLAQSILRNHGIKSEILVFGGDSSNMPECVEACKQVYKYGIKASTQKTNYKGTINKYGIDRYGMDGRPLSEMKSKIDTLASEGTGWMLWMVHTQTNEFDQDFADRLEEAIAYAISQGITIGTAEYGCRLYIDKQYDEY